METEFKEFLQLEKWGELFQGNDKQALEYEMTQLQDAVKEIKEADVNFEALSENQQEEQPQDIHYDRQKKQDLNLFGIDLTQLDNQTKNIIGIGLIVFIFALAAYGINWLNKKSKERTSQKKKKN